MIISSQRYIDENTVQEKREARDYVVTVSPEFEIDGVVMQAVIDGHHSLAAAEADGVEPEFIVASIQNDDRIALLDRSIDDYLEVCYMDSDWYDIETGKAVF
jgi:signal transduction histidine kinase